MTNVLYLSKEDIQKAITMADAIEAVKQAYSLSEKGQIDTPLRTVIPTADGSLLFMPAYAAELGLAVLKNVNVIPGNAEKNLPTTPAEILLIDATTGLTLAMLDGTYVTALRTGASSGAAFDVLAKKQCFKGAVIGTGGQAECQLDAMLAARDLKEVSVFSRNAEKRTAFAKQMQEKYADSGVSISAASDVNSCVKDADLIILTTTSDKPVFDGSFVKAGATVSCIGNYEPDKHETDPALLVRADKIFCDSYDAVLSEAGDLLIPMKQGLISKDKISGGLGKVINGDLTGRETDEEIIVFKSVGIAAQDLTTASCIYNKIK